MLELAIDMTRMAFIHTPSKVAASLGLIAAILLGQFAVDVGLFVPETILYQAVAVLAFFAIPNYEFGMATRLFRPLGLDSDRSFLPVGIGGWGAGDRAGDGLYQILGLPYLCPWFPKRLAPVSSVPALPLSYSNSLPAAALYPSC